MPLWLIFHPEGTFTTPESKQALVNDITPIYTSAGLPAFYVIVNFIVLPRTSIFVGGRNPTPEKPFIRFMIDHIAVHVTEDVKRQERVLTRIEKALAPHVRDKGYEWELHIDDTPRALWRIGGLAPPPCEFAFHSYSVFEGGDAASVT